jgi:hypothetical protein
MPPVLKCARRRGAALCQMRLSADYQRFLTALLRSSSGLSYSMAWRLGPKCKDLDDARSKGRQQRD